LETVGPKTGPVDPPEPTLPKRPLTRPGNGPAPIFKADWGLGPPSYADRCRLTPATISWQYLNGLRNAYPATGLAGATLQFCGAHDERYLRSPVFSQQQLDQAGDERHDHRAGPTPTVTAATTVSPGEHFS